MKEWIRLYCDVLDDEKVAQLSDRTYRIFTYLLLLTKENGSAGTIAQSPRDIAWRFRMPRNHIEHAIGVLVDKGIVTIDDDNVIEFVNWSKRQYKSDNVTERTKRFRERSRNVPVNVIEQSTEQNRILYVEKRFTGIEPDQLERWKSSFPAVNIETEINRAASWLEANPKNKKSNYLRFLNNWFSRAQDRAPAKGGNGSEPKPASHVIVPTTTCPSCKKPASEIIDGHCIDCAPRKSLADIYSKIGRPI